MPNTHFTLFLLLFVGACTPKITAPNNHENPIPFAKSLEAANVSLPQITNGQEQGMLIGNGDMYGLVWQSGANIQLRITKNDIWDARVNTEKDGPLPRVNIAKGTVSGPVGAPPSYDLPYPQPKIAATIQLQTPDTLHRSGHLDIGKAVATVLNGKQVQAQCRILPDDNVLMVESPYPIRLLSDGNRGTTDGVQWAVTTLPGDLDYPGMTHAVAMASQNDRHCIAVVTSFEVKNGTVLEHAIAMAQKAIQQPESALVNHHEKTWAQFWSRSGLELDDKVMERWWYRMLYFAKTVCKPGAAPVGLMPPLATDETPWHADFHHNYNAWQAFWPLPAANHPELADPWITYNHTMIPRYRFLARTTYGIEGLHVPISSFLHEPDPAVCTSNNQRQMSMNPWGLTIGLQSMTLQSMWQKFLCDQDVAYMKEKIYPFAKEVALFYTAFMDQCATDKGGKIRLGPSYSPEHGDWGIYNCPFDIAYVHYAFDAFTEAAEILGTDKDLAEKCRKYRALLPDYPTNTHPNGTIIVVDWSGGAPIAEHNITVPAAPVFPADQVTWFSPEAQKQLFKQTIRATRFNGNNAHVMFNIAKARLSMPEGYTDGRKWFSERELPNGFFVWQGHKHGTYMQEMIGVAGLINEYLLQSVDDKIRLFPAWPADQNARFVGLRAQGGFIVSAEWKQGKVVSATIQSVATKKLQLLSPWKTIYINGKRAVVDAEGLVTVPTVAGQILHFSEYE
jgi:hypothetical protein